MENTKTPIETTMAKLAHTIQTAPESKRDEVRIFLEGYTAGLEHVLATRPEEVRAC